MRASSTRMVPQSRDRTGVPALQRTSRRCTASGTRNVATQKKAAWFPRRPFLSYGSHTLAGDFRTSAPGAYFPAVSYSVTAASRGSRELEPDTDAMVSHLRKMSPLSRDNADGTRRRRRMSPLIPLFTGLMAVVEGACNRRAIAKRAAMTIVSASRRPGLIVAGRLGAAAAGKRRAGGTVGRGRAGHVWNMRLFPFARRVALFGRGDIDGVMQPAMP